MKNCNCNTLGAIARDQQSRMRFGALSRDQQARLIVPRSPIQMMQVRALRGLGFGTLGTSALVGKGVTAVASGVSGAIVGAEIGSVVPGIGTAVGFVVGYLTSKLFGHADYAVVYADIANVRTLFQAYQQVAGTVPGRVYGSKEMQQIWHGAMVSGFFPGNGPPAGVVCTQKMISNKINACGTGQWIDNLLGNIQKPLPPGANNIAQLVGAGLAQGISDPTTMADKVLLPGVQAIAARKGNAWISPSASQSPSLYRQMLIDTADVLMYAANPNLPVTYGQIPGSSQAGAPPAPVYRGPPPAAPVQYGVPVSAPTVAPASVSTPSAAPQVLSPNGASIAIGSGATLTTAQGVWSFSNTGDGTGNDYVLLNGTNTNGLGTQLAILNGQPVTLRADGSTWGWNGSAWVNLTPATLQPSAAYAPVQPAYSASPAPAPSPVDMSAYGGSPTPSAPAVAAATVAPATAGLSGNSSLLIAGGLAVVAVLFATARPHGRLRRGRSRK